MSKRLPTFLGSAGVQAFVRQVARHWDDRDTTYFPNLHSTAQRGESNMAGRVADGRGRSSLHQGRADQQRSSAKEGGEMASQSATQGVLWVDAVGGYLVTLKDDILIGQAVPDPGTDVTIQADISRRHARIQRAGEDYLVHPYAVVTVDSQPIVKATPLADGAEIGLGRSVTLLFRKPHALSNSACLTVSSGQRLEPAVDGVILMGETCLLGPAAENHICCDHWDGSVVLSRGDEGKLKFRAGERLDIDGTTVGDQGQVAWGSRVSGKNFAITLERL